MANLTKQPSPQPSQSTLTLDSLACIDIRTLTQSELLAVSLCSSSAFDLRRTDDLVIPSIDRSTFNESAGSRRQTFSRPRPRPSSSPTHHHHHHHRNRLAGLLPSLKPSPVTEDPDRRENHSIISFLKQSLRNLPEFYDIDFDYIPPFSALPDANFPFPEAAVNSENFGVGGERKRKRGRKPKPKVTVDEREWGLEIANKNGMAVDLVGLADLEDPYGEELRRRTGGMGNEEDLLGFLRDLDGSWCSRRRKRKIVDAGNLGDVLPVGWKLLLGLKRKEGRTWIYCRRYISPGGRQFVSCKDVSTYLQSCFGQDVQGTINRGSNNVQHDGCGVTSESKHPVVNQKEDDRRQSNEQSKEVTLLSIDNLAEVQIHDLFECHKCNMTFDEKDTYLQHLLSVHQRNTRKYRLGSSVGDGVIVKDGKFECQFCHKVFHERRRYNGHVGIHVRNYVRSIEEPPGHMALEKRTGCPTKDEFPTRISKMDALIEIAQNSILENSAVPSDEPTGESTPDKLNVVSNQELPASNTYNERNSNSPLSEPEIKDDLTDRTSELDLLLQNSKFMIYDENMEKIHDANVVDVEMESCLDTTITLSIDDLNGNNSQTFRGKDSVELAAEETEKSGTEQEGGAESHLLAPLSNQKVSDVENNVNLVCASTPEALKPDEVDNNENFGFVSKNGPANDILTQQTSEENVLSNVSEAISVLQPPHDLQTLNVISHKGEDGLCSIDQLNLTEVPLDMENNEGMERMYDSSVQFGSEEVMLNMAGGSQLTTVCVWCGMEFSHDVVDSVQSDSVGYMCPACKAKISGPVNSFGGGSAMNSHHL